VAGFYVVTNSFLNVRAAATTSSKKLGSLSLGQVVAVTEIASGWGRISYGGSAAYISLDYADFVSPLQYTVQYQADEKVWEDQYFSFDIQTAQAAPEIAGSSFVGWEDAVGRRYGVGEALPAGDLKLTAVYEVLPVEPEPRPEEPSTPPEASPELPETAPEEVPPAEEQLPEAPPPLMEPDPRAAVHAGVVSGIFSAVLGIWWYIRRFLR